MGTLLFEIPPWWMSSVATTTYYCFSYYWFDENTFLLLQTAKTKKPIPFTGVGLSNFKINY